MKNHLRKTGSIILLSSISLSLVACSSEKKEPTIENQRNTVKKIDDEKKKEIQRGKALLANKIAKEKAKEKREKVKLKKSKQKDKQKALKRQRLLAQQEEKEQKTLSGSTKKRNKSSSGKNSRSPVKSSSDNTTNTTQKSTQTQEPSKNFKNCDELRTVYSKGVPSSHPAYQAKMDRDKDGWACEISK